MIPPKFVFVLAAFSAVVFSSCGVTNFPKISSTPLRAGMTSKDLIVAYGAPVRVEPKADGGAEWIYSFVTGFSESGTEIEDDCGELEVVDYDAAGVAFEKDSIHVSPEGRVIGELPAGRVVRK